MHQPIIVPTPWQIWQVNSNSTLPLVNFIGLIIWERLLQLTCSCYFVIIAADKDGVPIGPNVRNFSLKHWSKLSWESQYSLVFVYLIKGVIEIGFHILYLFLILHKCYLLHKNTNISCRHGSPELSFTSIRRGYRSFCCLWRELTKALKFILLRMVGILVAYLPSIHFDIYTFFMLAITSCWNFCIGIPERSNDSLGLQKALKDPHRIRNTVQHMHAIHAAMK